MGAFSFHPSRWIFCISLGFLLLCFFGTFAEHRFGFIRWLYPQPPEALSQWMGQPATVSARVVSEVDRRSNRQEAIIRVSEPPIGRGLLVHRLFPVLKTGMVLQLRCKIAPSRRGDALNDDPSLRLKRVFWICRYPPLAIRGQQLDFPRKMLFAFKTWAIRTINRSFPEPHASFLAGLLFGVRRSMPEFFYSSLQKTGTMHLIAISGYNISLVLNVVLRTTERLGLARMLRLGLAGASLVSFVILTGASASVLRAAVMGGLGVLAIAFGRKQIARQLLFVAAGLMAAFQPLIVRYDIGFQLSFAATFGLIHWSSRLERRMVMVPEAYGLRQTLAATLAANIAVTPLLITYFGSISLIAVVENLLILPLIPWMMLGGFVFLLGAAVAPFASGWLAMPTLLLLHAAVSAISLGAALPFAQWVFRSP